MTAAVEVRALRKSYNGVEAVRGIDFAIETGEVFGLLGPNGAGKTTTVEILEGYRSRDGGDVTVLGYDPARGQRAFRARIGVVLQHAEPFFNLTVRETHAMFARYYPHPRDVERHAAYRNRRLSSAPSGVARRSSRPDPQRPRSPSSARPARPRAR